MTKTKRTINIQPDFEKLFRNMLAMALDQAEPASMFCKLKPEERADAFAEVQRFFAPLAIAGNSMLNVEMVDRFQQALSTINTRIAEAAAARTEEPTADQMEGIL